MTPNEPWKTIQLADVVKANAAIMELYGTTEIVVDEDALKRKLQAMGLVDGFDQALADVESRLEILRLRNDNS